MLRLKLDWMATKVNVACSCLGEVNIVRMDCIINMRFEM